ncbi:hypothetical protein GCM10022378_09400 [Salinicoccus jeotgali]|uniref:DUF4760 domain-containing protein n=1 Tax=Salinicoccus jeotgali TaxID=381634 RepID=A0ABP7EQN4_9STAP
MTCQGIIEIGNSIFSSSLVASLLGVVVGGFITYKVQKQSMEKQQQFERKKMKYEENKKNQETKIKAYSKILHLNSTHMVSEWDHHTSRTELYGDKYMKYIQPILYEIYHLLDDDIAKEIDYIEISFERIYILGSENDDKWSLGHSYSKILTEIRKEFEDIRKSRSSA